MHSGIHAGSIRGFGQGPLPRVRMPASIDMSVKLAACLAVAILTQRLCCGLAPSPCAALAAARRCWFESPGGPCLVISHLANGLSGSFAQLVGVRRWSQPAMATTRQEGRGTRAAGTRPGPGGLRPTRTRSLARLGLGRRRASGTRAASPSRATPRRAVCRTRGRTRGRGQTRACPRHEILRRESQSGIAAVSQPVGTRTASG